MEKNNESAVELTIGNTAYNLEFKYSESVGYFEHHSQVGGEIVCNNIPVPYVNSINDIELTSVESCNVEEDSYHLLDISSLSEKEIKSIKKAILNYLNY